MVLSAAVVAVIKVVSAGAAIVTVALGKSSSALIMTDAETRRAARLKTTQLQVLRILYRIFSVLMFRLMVVLGAVRLTKEKENARSGAFMHTGNCNNSIPLFQIMHLSKF